MSDKVYCKTTANHEWHGRASVLCQDGKQVLIKDGLLYVLVHRCRLQICQKEEVVKEPTEATSIADNSDPNIWIQWTWQKYSNNIRNTTRANALPLPPEKPSETSNKSGPPDYQPHVDEYDMITPPMSALK